MNQAQRLKTLQDTGKTVFSAAFLRQMWQLPEDTFRTTVKRMVDGNALVRLSKGVYALSDTYSAYELANTLVTPSYISFNTALAYHGIAFQAGNEIASAANFNYVTEIDGREYAYHKMKQSLLYDTDGLITGAAFTIATPERAVLDCIYREITPNLDNAERISHPRLTALSDTYPARVRQEAEKLAR